MICFTMLKFALCFILPAWASLQGVFDFVQRYLQSNPLCDSWLSRGFIANALFDVTLHAKQGRNSDLSFGRGLYYNNPNLIAKYIEYWGSINKRAINCVQQGHAIYRYVSESSSYGICIPRACDGSDMSRVFKKWKIRINVIFHVFCVIFISFQMFSSCSDCIRSAAYATIGIICETYGACPGQVVTQQMKCFI